MGGGRKPKPSEITDPKISKTSSVDHETRKRVEKSIREKSPKLTCPKYLSPVAKKEFKKMIKIYKSLAVNILSDLDIPTIASYCQSVAIYQDKLNKYNLNNEKLVNYENELEDFRHISTESMDDAEKEVHRNMRISQNSLIVSTQLKMDRALNIMDKQTRIMNSLADSLCLTPVGRARMGILAVKKQEKNTKLARLKQLKDDD